MSQMPSNTQSSLLLSSLSRLTSSILSFDFQANEANLPDGTVSTTSQTCAALRAIESNLPSATRLFTDPLAEALAGPAAMARVRSRSSSGTARIAIRTRYFDDFANLHLGAPLNERMQLVLLGAGMDSRAYRLHNLSDAVDVFELDRADVLQLKERLLRKIHPAPEMRAKTVHRICADLGDSSWGMKLEAAGFDPRVRTVWLMEGVLYYLTEREVEGVFKVLEQLSVEGSAVCFSAVTELSESRQKVRKMFRSTIEDPAGFVAKFGFKAESVDTIGGPKVNYGRWKTADGEPIPVRGSGVYVQCSKI